MTPAYERAFCLDCWKREYGQFDPDLDTPFSQVWGDTRQELEEQAQRLWNARDRNGFKCLLLYQTAGLYESNELRCWPEQLP